MGESRFEILEHTADVGIRAEGESLSDVFEQATLGLADIMGIYAPGAGDREDIEMEAPDTGALLVDWLSEILWLHDSRDALLAGVEVADVTGTTAKGCVVLAPRAGRRAEGTQVKAITYHQLDVAQTASGWRAVVFVDV
jgi:SHS2 domain-containing protein